MALNLLDTALIDFADATFLNKNVSISLLLFVRYS